MEEYSLISQGDFLIKTNNVKLAIEEVKNKLHDYVILFQQQKPLSPFSDFILEFCKIEELPRIFNGQYISKRVEDYIISLFRGEDVGVHSMFEEYFEDNEFYVTRNEFFTALLAVLEYIAKLNGIKYFILVLNSKEISLSLEKFIDFVLDVKQEVNFIIVDSLNDPELFQNPPQFSGRKLNILNFFYRNDDKLEKDGDIDLKVLLSESYKWMAWETCIYVANQIKSLGVKLDLDFVEPLVYSHLGAFRNEDAIDYTTSAMEGIKEEGNTLLLAKYNRLLAYIYAITQSRWNLTVESAKKAMEFAVKSGDKRQIIFSKAQLFFVGALSGEEALNLLEDIKKIKKGKASLKRLYYHIVSFYYFFVSTRDILGLEKINRMIRSASRYYKRNRDYYHLALLHHLRGNILMEEGENNEAIREVRKSLKLAKRLKSRYITHLYNSLSHLLYTSGKFRESYKFAKESLLLTVKENDIKEVCMSLVNMSYLYMIINDFKKANFVMDLLFRIMYEAKIEELPIHPNVKLWVMDVYIKDNLGLISPCVSMVYNLKEIENLNSEALAFYYWGMSIQSKDLDEKIKLLYKSLEYIGKNEFKYVEVKILRDLIISLKELGKYQEAENLENYFVDLRRNYKFYGVLLSTEKVIINLPLPNVNWELVVNEAKNRYNLLQLQDRINQIKFLERIQGIVISENREEKLIEKFLNIITNSFPNDVVMFVDRERGSVYLPSDYSEKIDVKGLVNFDIFATSPKRSIPQLYNLPNSFVLPFVFSNGEVRGYLVVGSFSEGKFLKADEINIIDISSMLVKSKLEILANLRKIEKISKTDFLTGLPNRNGIDDVIISEVERCKRDANYNFSLVMIDLDNFKYYNDTFGHMVGDIVLKEFAAILKSNVRKLDFVGRYGGDEFVVIMPNTDRDKAVYAAKRWIKGVFSTDFYLDVIKSLSQGNVTLPDDKKLSMSVGVADFKESGYNIQKLFDLSDKRLYTSKSKGKGIVS